MEMISITTVQKCQQSDTQFSKVWFKKLLDDNMTQEQFDRFCREVMLLNERYTTTCGLHVTDRPDKVIQTDDVMWKLEEINFNQPITFKKVK